MSGDAIGAVVGGLSGVIGAAVTGWLLVRREREAQRPAEHHSAVDGYDALTGRLEAEVAHVRAELAAVRAELAAARAEVEECERSRLELTHRVEILAAEVADLRRTQ